MKCRSETSHDAPADVATKPVTGPTLQKYCKAVRLMITSTNMTLATLHYLREFGNMVFKCEWD